MDISREPSPVIPHKSLFSVVALGTNGFAVLLIMPLLVGGMIGDYGFTERQAGFVSSVELAALAVSSIIALWWMGRTNWRTASLVSMVGLAAANIATQYAEGYTEFILVRLLAGVFSGSACAITAAAIAQTNNADRNFGFYIVGQLVFATIGFWALPDLMQARGTGYAYGVLCGSALITAILARYVPLIKNVEQLQITATNTHTKSVLVLSVLLAMFLFFAVQGGVWAYIERMGNYSGLTVGQIGLGLGIASLAGLGGAGIATLLGGRWSHSWPLTIAIFAQLGVLIMLSGRMSLFGYTFASSIFNFAWCLILPLFLGMLAALDLTGKAAVLGSATISVGLAAGPAIAALSLTGNGYRALCVFAAGACIASLVVSVPALFHLHRTHGAKSQ